MCLNGVYKLVELSYRPVNEMDNPPFEDVCPIKHGDVPLPCQFTGVYILVKSVGGYQSSMTP